MNRVVTLFPLLISVAGCLSSSLEEIRYRAAVTQANALSAHPCINTLPRPGTEPAVGRGLTLPSCAPQDPGPVQSNSEQIVCGTFTKTASREDEAPAEPVAPACREGEAPAEPAAPSLPEPHREPETLAASEPPAEELRPAALPIKASCETNSGGNDPDASQRGRPNAVRFCVTRSDRVMLRYAVRNVEPSKAAVELWQTRDGQVWWKRDVVPRDGQIAVSLPEEGLHGLRLMPCGSRPNGPAQGEDPQAWVMVDRTKPSVELLDVACSPAGKPRSLTVRWKVSDHNLGGQPIRLLYAKEQAGPWMAIASNLPDTGLYRWRLPVEVPGHLLFRVEATDLAGNSAEATSAEIVLEDTLTLH
jgi:hypothetical protein